MPNHLITRHDYDRYHSEKQFGRAVGGMKLGDIAKPAKIADRSALPRDQAR
jgi:hypothetical protein